MTATLTIHQEEDITDLAIWADDHAINDDGCVFDLLVIADLQTWMNKVMESTNSYPITVPVPQQHVAILKAVIEDWCEVLSSHGDEFHTDLITEPA